MAVMIPQLFTGDKCYVDFFKDFELFFFLRNIQFYDFIFFERKTVSRLNPSCLGCYVSYIVFSGDTLSHYYLPKNVQFELEICLNLWNFIFRTYLWRKLAELLWLSRPVHPSSLDNFHTSDQIHNRWKFSLENLLAIYGIGTVD